MTGTGIAPPPERRWPVLFGRAVLLACPNCGARPILDGWFGLQEHCPRCGLRPQRGERDYFIGAYLFNLIALELLFAAGLVIVAVTTYPDTPWRALEVSALVLSVAAAVICYPFAKLTWLALDLSLRPLSAKELDWHRRGGLPNEGELPHL